MKFDNPPMTLDEARCLTEEGRRDFNRGAYFAAHECWEKVWLKAYGQERVLLQGLIQIATALYKLCRGRQDLCKRLLDKGLLRLTSGGLLFDLDLDGLRRDAALLRDALSPAVPLAENNTSLGLLSARPMLMLTIVQSSDVGNETTPDNAASFNNEVRSMSAEQGNKQSSFFTDIKELRRRAREHMEKGAVTSSYQGDRETVVKVLNEALATEIVCVLRYMRHHYMASGIHSEAVAAEFREHANEEQQHADRIAARIVQLDGEPNFNPDGLSSRSHAEYVEGKNLGEMLRENLVAERIAIESYSEIIRYLGDKDPTTRRLMEEILAKEEEHAEDLQSLLQRFSEKD